MRAINNVAMTVYVIKDLVISMSLYLMFFNINILSNIFVFVTILLIFLLQVSHVILIKKILNQLKIKQNKHFYVDLALGFFFLGIPWTGLIYNITRGFDANRV